MEISHISIELNQKVKIWISYSMNFPDTLKQLKIIFKTMLRLKKWQMCTQRKYVREIMEFLVRRLSSFSHLSRTKESLLDVTSHC
jgi:hypothetical protein